jgi:hypothetical protein
LNRVLAPEGEDLSCRDKKGPKEAPPGWRDISLRFAPAAWRSPYGASLRRSATRAIPRAPFLALGRRLAVLGRAIRGPNTSFA